MLRRPAISFQLAVVLVLLTCAVAPAQSPSNPLGRPLTLRLIQPNWENPEAQPKITVAPLSGVYLSRTAYGVEGHTTPVPLPQGSALLAVDVRITNQSKEPVSLAALGSFAGAGFGGEFDVPRGVYEQVFGKREKLVLSTPWLPPGPPFACDLSDQSVQGDCEIAFEAKFRGGEESLPPGASGQALLQANSPDPRFSVAVPEDFDASGVRVFIRDPRDQANYPTQFLMPCSDPTRPPTEVGALGLLEGWAVDPSAYEERTHEPIEAAHGEGVGCELPLTLELRLPGETAPPVSVGEDRPGPDCRIFSLDSASDSSVNIGVLAIGSKGDVEQSYRGDHHWYVNTHGESNTGIGVGGGTRLGPLEADIEASGRFAFGGESELRFASGNKGKRQAEEIVSYIDGDLHGNSKAEAHARALALHSLGATYLESGVDLDGSIGGTPGRLQVGISTPQGVVRYSSGERGIYSTLSASGDFTIEGAAGPLALGAGGEGLRSTELDFTDEGEPTILAVRDDAAASDGLSPPDLTGTATAVLGHLKDAEASLSAGGRTGFGFSLQDVAELTKTGNPAIRKGARELLDALESSPELLPPDVSSIAQSLSADSTEYLVLSQQGTASSHTGVAFSGGLKFGLDFGDSVTTEQAIYASKRPPAGSFGTWAECLPGS